MRRSCFALLPLLVLAVTAHATSLEVGVRAGSSIPNLRDNGGNELSSGWSSRVAPYAGVYGDVRLTPALSLEVGIDYAPQGGKHDGLQAIPVSPEMAQALPAGTRFVYADFRHESRLTYVEVPVLLQYRLGLPMQSVTIAAGPYAGFLVSAREITSGQSVIYADRSGTQAVSPGPQPFDADTNIRDAIHSTNWGVQAGLGTSRSLGAGRVRLDVRGSLGLTNIQRYAADGKNSTGNLVVALGYGVGLGTPR